MSDRSEDRAAPRLPREWLPDPRPPEGAPEWDARVERIMAAADPELRGLGTRRRAVAATSWSVMGLWWKPAAALAAAATALLVVTERPTAVPEPPPASIALGLVASDGDPVTLWGAFGIPADPVLARIALQGREEVMGQGLDTTTPEGETR